jgi:hypothetical protein
LRRGALSELLPASSFAKLKDGVIRPFTLMQLVRSPWKIG